MLLLISETNDEKHFIIRTYIVEKTTSGVEGGRLYI